MKIQEKPVLIVKPAALRIWNYIKEMKMVSNRTDRFGHFINRKRPESFLSRGVFVDAVRFGFFTSHPGNRPRWRVHTFAEVVVRNLDAILRDVD